MILHHFIVKMVATLSSETLVHLLHDTATYPRRQFSSRECTVWESTASGARIAGG
jgi:hypothetical protein